MMSMADEPDLMPGRIGPYEIVLPIASGGTATVYLARALAIEEGKPRDARKSPDRYVALKLTLPHLRRDRSFSRQLLDEARLTKGLRHPNVIAAFDMGESEEGVFLVMEYIPGDSLAGLRRLASASPGGLPRRVALRILIDGLRGLHAAHEHRDETGKHLAIVHRDFTPRNLLVGTDGIARLTDFGLARASSRMSNTDVGSTKGTLHYLAPEQVTDAPLDRRCDLWAAGVIAWEIMTGARLYDGEERSSLEPNRPEPPRIKTVVPLIATDALDLIVARALMVDREHRISSALELANELEDSADKAKLLADHEEVAKVVVELVGPELVERRELLDQARREMHKRPVSAPDVRTMVGMAGPLSPKRPPLPSLPERPSLIDDGRSELRIAVEFAANPERASVGVLGAPPSPTLSAEPPEPEVFRSPLGGGEAEPPAPSPTPTRATPEVAFAIFHDVVKPWVTPPWTTKKISILAGGFGAVGFLIVLMAASSSSKSNARPSTQNTSSTQTSSSALALTPPPLTTTSADPSRAGGEEPTSSEARGETLQVKANAPIASVTIVNRFVDAVVPTSTLNVDLEDDEGDKMLRITVTGTDGRIAMATVEPGVREVEVTFAPKAPRVKPRSTPKRR